MINLLNVKVVIIYANKMYFVNYIIVVFYYSFYVVFIEIRIAVEYDIGRATFLFLKCLKEVYYVLKPLVI